jgi:4-hydroxyphenylacetate 3-monooxygenase
VKDVTTHPAFRNAAVSVAQLYDALHDAKSKNVLTAPTDTGSGGYTHKFFKAAFSREDVIAQRDAIAAWARISYGWMGRSPDYKAAFLNTLGANAEFYGKFAANARTWHKRAQEAVLYLNHALVNPPIDRNKPVEQVKDVYITIQRRPTPASSFRAPRWSPPTLRLPTTTFSARTWVRRLPIRAWW